ncbi:MAG: hypothetical protein HYZ40_15805 [Rhodospirillales bacterium]|nr:hypothetical protein [Rhodospirillales bacterium]
MNIDFHAPANRFSYTGREVQPDWVATVQLLVDPAARRVTDIGCGGGLYSAAWADLGAAEVDVSLPGSPDHIRGYFFECFPRLLETERARRPTVEAVVGALGRAGFGALQTVTVWETRKRHHDFRGLAADLLGRVGRSILHALTDAELNELVDFIGQRLPANAPLVERDRWTIWSGTKT